MSHYPTTAELAAFREDIHRLSGPHFTDDCTVGMSHPPEGGAWLDELSNGIGYRMSADDDLAWCGCDECWPGGPGWGMQVPRREAGAMRTRAFRALADQARGDAGLTDDLIAAMDAFEPSDPAYV